MSDISDKEWEEFLEADEESASPFGVQNQVDPLIFVESKEAPELRAVNLPKSKESYYNPEPQTPAPYFVNDDSDNSRAQWVPKPEQSQEVENSEVEETTTSIIRLILQGLLFMAPLAVIAVTFAIALSIE